MTTFRLMQTSELAEAARLSDSVFRQGKQPSMGEMFPNLFAPGMPHSYGAFAEDGSLAAFMGLAPSTLRAGGAAQIGVFSIGSVCTAPEHRGVGLAGRLLERCFAHAVKAEAPLLFVSGDRSLYTRAGCSPFGSAATAVIRPLALQDSLAFRGDLHAPHSPPGLIVREARTREARAENLLRLHRLHEAGSTRFEESAAGFGARLEAAAYCGVLGLTQRVILAVIEDTPVAYAVIGVPHHVRGFTDGGAAPIPTAPDSGQPTDQPPTVISYGGEPEYAADLLERLPGSFGLNELHIPIPWQERELLTYMKQAGAECRMSANAGTLFVTNVQMLLDQASPLWPRPWTEALRVEKGRVLSAASRRELQRSEWLALLLDPDAARPDDVPSWLTPIALPYLYGLHYT
ncbi:GNAT family N-acetyltransferase [Saccharibacillus deserti]|uniref:GNAT family N-acetyltransferase n=1 Tax=Saccharibacillus deserti TaxID=1634444 RepID=UPI001553B4F2|nr:GNAT family N-acetyltransferase [Saccharibacillus deserti]